MNIGEKVSEFKNLENLFPGSFLKIAVVGRGSHFIPYREALVNSIRKFGFEAKGFDSLKYDYKPDVFLIINPIQYKNERFNKRDFIYAGICKR